MHIDLIACTCVCVLLCTHACAYVCHYVNLSSDGQIWHQILCMTSILPYFFIIQRFRMTVKSNFDVAEYLFFAHASHGTIRVCR